MLWRGIDDDGRGPAHRGNNILGISGDTVLEKVEAADFTVMFDAEEAHSVDGLHHHHRHREGGDGDDGAADELGA